MAAVQPNPAQNYNPIWQHIALTIADIVGFATGGALFAKLFTVIKPLVAAEFCTSYAVMYTATKTISSSLERFKFLRSMLEIGLFTLTICMTLSATEYYAISFLPAVIILCGGALVSSTLCSKILENNYQP